MAKCEICNKELKDFKALANHIRIHKVTSKEYYDKYLRKKGEGICPECGKETRYKRITSGYCDYCSLTCKSKSKKVTNKQKQTCLERYGVENPMQEDTLKEKQKQMLLKNYGVENPSQLDVVKEKKTQTCLKHHGVKNPSQSKEIIEKKKQTCLTNIGVEYPAQSQEVRNKQKQTMLNNYGVEFSLQSKKILNKQKQTNLKRYGTEHPSSLKEFQEKTKQTNIKKYGVECTFQSKKIRERSKQTMLEKYKVTSPNHFHITNYDKWEDIEFIKKTFLTDKKTVKSDEMMKFFNIKSQSNVYLHLKALDIEYIRMGGTSQYEAEIYEFLRFELGILNVIQNDRQLIKPLELDFFLPDYDLAIEFDGIFWHSQQQINDKNYHLNKTIMCENEGVQLIHIFEPEWVNKCDIIKSILKSKLHKLTKLCGARQTVIKEITPKESAPFLNKNHRQGSGPSSIKLGAYYNGELVSVMTFSKPSIAKGRKDNDSITNFELARFASVMDYNIPGMASKFLTYFKNNYLFDNLFTFADRRYSDGAFYSKLGFELTNTTNPCYWYFEKDSINLTHRFKYRKSELSRLLNKFDPSLTEYQNMLENSFDRIFDCGNYRFVLISKEIS